MHEFAGTKGYILIYVRHISILLIIIIIIMISLILSILGVLIV